ncbi:uncharacterized protein LOC142348589 [Convolutriloba macropyga]|uniref:uncharacterized protein LOC142348589 n=1 Tax=Convolutriloba macropyga TaxID=536237 RepID=UPI003F52476C
MFLQLIVLISLWRSSVATDYTYLVTIVTSQEATAGTNDVISIRLQPGDEDVVLNGANLVTDEELDDLESIDLFQEGSTHHFHVTTQYDYVHSARISKRGNTGHWKLRKVEVTRDGQKWQVTCNCWFLEYIPQPNGNNPRLIEFPSPQLNPSENECEEIAAQCKRHEKRRV